MNETFVSYDKYISDNKELLIIPDPGHGGIVNGKYDTAPAKMWKYEDFIFYEGVFNRAMALRISSILLEKNISHAFTTDSNFDVSLPIRINKAKTIKNKYLHNNNLFLSLHANAASINKAKGMEIFTLIGKSHSDEVATNIFNSLAKIGWRMRKDTTDGDPDKEAKFYVLRKGEEAKFDSVLIEYGFFTNEEEAKLMMEPEIQKQLAILTVEGILKSYGL